MLLLLPLLFLLAEPARPPPPPDLDPFSASEEADEMDPEEDWPGDKALMDFPPRGMRRKRQAAFLEPALHTRALLEFPPRGMRRKRQAAFLEPAPHTRYVEDARIPIQHRGVALQMAPPEECACPEPLAKGTLVAMVAVLAFLGFFSTSVLLVVAVCLLRLVERQRKSGKDANAAGLANRPLPPLPPPRPERVYLATKPASGYERLMAASPRTPEGGAYLSASELHPGPRSHQKMGVDQAAVAAETESRNLPESEYITVNPAPGFSSPVPPKTYSGAGGIPSPVPPKMYSGAGGISSPVPPKTYSGAGGISSPVPPKTYSGAGGISSPVPPKTYSGAGGISSSVPPKTYSGAGGISSPVPPKIYSAAGAQILSPGKNEEEIYGSPEGTKPEKSGEASPIAETPLSGRENHIYEEVE